MARTKEFDKEEVLEKAIGIFWAKGFNATSMQDLVDGLGISRSSLYDTFGDKESLFYAALNTYTSKYQAIMVQDIINAPSPLTVIKSFFSNQIAQSVNDSEHKGCLIVNTATELAANSSKANEFVCENVDIVVNAFAQAIEKGQQMGEITKANSPLQLARFLFNASIGMRVSARTGTDGKILSDIASITIASLQA